MQDSSQIILQHSPDTTVARVISDSFATSPKKKILQAVHRDTVLKAATHSNTAVVATIKKQDAVISSSAEKEKPASFFSGHELKAVHQGPELLNRHTPDWVFPLLLLIVVAFAWLRTYYNKYFTQIITAFFNNNLTNQIVRDENILVQRASILLNIVFNLVAAVYLYFISIHLNWTMGGIGTGLNRYIFFALVVSAAYAMKFLVLKICGYLFKLDREMATYIFNIFLINNVLGILLIPVVALLAFGTGHAAWITGTSVFLVAAAFLYRIIRGIGVGITSPVSTLYYLFLYLCALEFAPLMVLIKVLNQN